MFTLSQIRMLQQFIYVLFLFFCFACLIFGCLHCVVDLDQKTSLDKPPVPAPRLIRRSSSGRQHSESDSRLNENCTIERSSSNTECNSITSTLKQQMRDTSDETKDSVSPINRIVAGKKISALFEVRFSLIFYDFSGLS